MLLVTVTSPLAPCSDVQRSFITASRMRWFGLFPRRECLNVQKMMDVLPSFQCTVILISDSMNGNTITFYSPLAPSLTVVNRGCTSIIGSVLNLLFQHRATMPPSGRFAHLHLHCRAAKIMTDSRDVVVCSVVCMKYFETPLTKQNFIRIFSVWLLVQPKTVKGRKV